MDSAYKIELTSGLHRLACLLTHTRNVAKHTITNVAVCLK